jgi:hypothetical protein
MKLSEAIRIGNQLRPACGELGDRFVVVEGRGLCSDVWGAACEAVQPGVALFNWNLRDRFKLAATMDAFVAVQLHYFADYFKMPARCPGSTQRWIEMGGRLLTQDRKVILKTYDDHAKQHSYSITSECDKVEQLAGLVDHFFYKHRMSRPDIATCVEAYENAREHGIAQQIAVNRNFNHYATNWR